MKPSAWTCLPQNLCNISSVWLGEGLQTEPSPGVAIEVSGIGEDGLPRETSSQFVVPLEDHSLHWLLWDWQSWSYVPFRVPAVGESVHITAPLVL